MRAKAVTFIALVVSGLILCASAMAHHGGSEYDHKNLVSVQGNVTDFYWANPHCQIFLNVKDENGKVIQWGVETNSPAVMERAGWTRKSLAPGDEVTITLAPSKKGTPVGLLRKLVFTKTGKELGAGSLGEQPDSGNSQY
jgi:uncharacterized protein DUF6152